MVVPDHDTSIGDLSLVVRLLVAQYIHDAIPLPSERQLKKATVHLGWWRCVSRGFQRLDPSMDSSAHTVEVDRWYRPFVVRQREPFSILGRCPSLHFGSSYGVLSPAVLLDARGWEF
jgi:hypothetical protein